LLSADPINLLIHISYQNIDDLFVLTVLEPALSELFGVLDKSNKLSQSIELLFVIIIVSF